MPHFSGSSLLTDSYNYMQEKNGASKIKTPSHTQNIAAGELQLNGVPTSKDQKYTKSIYGVKAPLHSGRCNICAWYGVWY